MSSNPYEAATVSSDFREELAKKRPNGIQWGSIVVCYLLAVVIHLMLMVGLGLVLGIVASALGEIFLQESARNILSLTVGLMPLVAVIISVLWLVRRVHRHKFLHAVIFSGLNFAIDVVLAITFSSTISWRNCVSIITQVIVILIAGWFAARWFNKSQAAFGVDNV